MGWQKLTGVANLMSVDGFVSNVQIRVRCDSNVKLVYITSTSDRALKLSPMAARHLAAVLWRAAREVDGAEMTVDAAETSPAAEE